MKVVFMGATRFSEEMLLHLLEHQVKINLILTIPEEFQISYAEGKVRNYNYADLGSIAMHYGIPCHEVDSVPGKKMADYEEVINAMKPDIILALGWYYMVPHKIRELARFGVWGIHASLLPKYAGGAPLVWAIINGEQETGVTLFRLNSGIDDGDIIAQRAFSIAFEDTVREAYANAIEVSKNILLDAVLIPERIEFLPQNKSLIQIYPQRKPEDGLIDLSHTALEIYNFIRAQTRPYPGAYSTVAGMRLTLWKVRYRDDFPCDSSQLQSGELFRECDAGFVRLQDGCLQLLEATYDGKDGDFAAIADQAALWGLRLGS